MTCSGLIHNFLLQVGQHWKKDMGILIPGAKKQTKKNTCFSDTKTLFFQPKIHAPKGLSLDNTETIPPITPQKSTAEWVL